MVNNGFLLRVTLHNFPSCEKYIFLCISLTCIISCNIITYIWYMICMLRWSPDNDWFAHAMSKSKWKKILRPTPSCEIRATKMNVLIVFGFLFLFSRSLRQCWLFQRMCHYFNLISGNKLVKKNYKARSRRYN